MERSYLYFALIFQCFGKVINDRGCAVLAKKVILLIGGVNSRNHSS